VDHLPRKGEIAKGAVFQIRNAESRYLTHLFHKFAGKFIPEVPAWAIERHLGDARGATILDPFAGSGTTLVEACLHSHIAYGIDIDPLARLISKVKTTRIPSKVLRGALRDLVARVPDALPNSSFVPTIPTIRHWFTHDAIDALSAILSCIDRYRSNTDLHDFLLICFSAIVRKVSNADNQTMKTYVSHTHQKTPEDARPLFLKTLVDYVARLEKFDQIAPAAGSAQILPWTDSTTLADYWANSGLAPIDLAITSPPYIKTVDYIYNQMAELFWIGSRWGLETQQKQNVFKTQYLGNDRIAAAEATVLPITGHDIVDEHIGFVHSRDRKLGATMAHYFRDLANHLRGMREILRPGAHYVIVVGDSTLAGYPVPTHDLVAAVATRSGFKVGAEFGYEVRNKYMRFPRAGRGGAVVHDWIVDLVSP
jgi:hypothetical protein